MNASPQATAPGAGELTIAKMKHQCGYDELQESGGVDALIDYKNALEDRLVVMIDEAARPPRSSA